MNLSHLFLMHGYGIYVWPAYCITLCILGFNVFSALKEKHQSRKRIQRYLNQHE